MSPKVSAAFGPWRGTELYANWGLGFHSNSGLGVVLQVDPFDGRTGRRRRRRSRERKAPSSASGPWPLRGLQTTATVWYLGLRFRTDLRR